MNWSFAFNSSHGALLPLAVIVAVGLVWLLYRRTTRPVGGVRRGLLGAMRWALLAALAVCLFEPTWVRTEPIRQKGLFAVVVDSSASMSLTDGPDGISRLDAARRIIEQAQPSLDGLGESFAVRYYALDTRPRRIGGLADCAPTGARTALLGAASELVGRYHGMPLRGALLISDGADNATEDVPAALERLHDAGVPVYTAGVGGPLGARDIEMTQFQLPWRAKAGAAMPARVTFTAQAEPGETMTVEVLQEGQLLATERVVWSGDAPARTVELKITPAGSGYQRFIARVAGPSAETITDNNRRTRFVKIEGDERPRLLYVEGHPRMEFKFLRRALETDTAVRFSGLLYIGQDRIFRTGLGPRELVAGIPERGEDLADFRAVVLGDFSARQLSKGQIEAIEEFVSKRGGGLLLLGGPLALREAGENSPLAALSPFRPPETAGKTSYRLGGPYRIHIAPGGKTHAALAAFEGLGAGADAVLSDSELPPLSGVNILPRLKPGAELLASWKSDQAEGPLLAVQRYGAGWVAAVASDELWRLRMRLPAADNRHERLVRGLAHWLANASQPYVLISVDREQAAPLEPVEVTVQAFDARQEPISTAEVELEITAPGGDTESLRMSPDLASPGTYRARWSGDRIGEYLFRAGVPSDGAKFDYARCVVNVTADVTEIQHAGRDDALLKRIAETTGGAFLASGEAPDLTAIAASVPEPEKITIRRSAWDRPWLLAALLALFCLELVLRRSMGLS